MGSRRIGVMRMRVETIFPSEVLAANGNPTSSSLGNFRKHFEEFFSHFLRFDSQVKTYIGLVYFLGLGQKNL